ncbi:CoA ester lyase [Gordonia sp. NB41Y]|uniref:HpcH/HpaI aldolase/citrate lyase family protein n=1 Tax=Gordonia sp. NB41Y TaxID=875808 RepID=UPI0006B2333F|nr:CoA ester lyase [Gordonia sp. NB41Y]KOY49065.1 aldolase [Gordonia sp. NB41Y]WLP89407.1 CoA ester lyase [Gordonia sp. NB41Y]
MTTTAAPTAQILSTARTFLFVPGNRPERFDKAAGAGADVVIIDLEDAVSPDDKPAAREHIAEWFGAGNSAVIRINAAGTPWHDDDVALAQRLSAPVVLAKAQFPDEVAAVTTATGAPVIPLVETARGILTTPALADLDGVVRIAFGAIDFAVQVGADPEDREALLFARSTLATASAAAGIGAPIDGVTTALRDTDKLVDDVTYAARIGLTGKLCIHPAQVVTVHTCLAPSEEEIAWARSILEAASSDSSAVAVDGHMVDPPVVARAERIIAAITPA